MKKVYLLTPALLSLSLLSGALLAEATVYGKANISLNMNDTEVNSVSTRDNWQLNSNASRLGFKGEQALDGGLKAVYQLEYEVAVDDGEAQSTSIKADCDDNDSTTDETCDSAESSFKQRNIFVGLEGGFGRIIAGYHDTPLKLAQGKLDRFNDLALGDIKNVLSGENRLGNIIMYDTPKRNGLQATLAFIPGEESGAVAGDDNGIADATSASIKYAADDFWLSLANDSDVKGMDNTRVSAEYTFKQFKLGVMAQSGEELASGIESTGYLISSQYTQSKWIFKAQYLASTEEDPTADIDQNLMTLGADYKLGKNAKLYAYASNWTEEQGTSETDSKTFGLGTELKF